MSGNTKTTLAIVFGVVGILLGALGTITAYNAKSAVDSDAQMAAEVESLVDERFKEAQTRQDQMEAEQHSQAEKFVNQLTRGEKNLLAKINGNHRRTNKLQRGNRRLKRQVRKLRNQVNTLSNRDRELAGEVAQLEAEQASEFDQLNKRINKTNRQIQRLQRQLSRLVG